MKFPRLGREELFHYPWKDYLSKTLLVLTELRTWLT